MLHHSNEGPGLFPRGDNYDLIAKIHWRKFCSPEPLGQFQPNLAQSILGWRSFKFVQIKGPTLRPLLRGDNNKIAKISYRSFTIFSRTISKFGTKHPWWRVKGHTFLQEEIIRDSNNTLTKFINILPQNYWAIFN